MKKFSFRLFAIISSGVKATGSYNPDEIMPFFEEQLTFAEVKALEPFFRWIEEDRSHHSFGIGNYQQRYQEYLNTKK